MSQEQQWHLIDGNGNQCGPYSAEQLQQYAAGGIIVPSTQVWTEGLEQWIAASQVEGLFPSQSRRPQFLTGAGAGAVRPLGAAPPSGLAGAAPISVARPGTGGNTLALGIGITAILLVIGAFVAVSISRSPATTAKADENPAALRDQQSERGRGHRGTDALERATSISETARATSYQTSTSEQQLEDASMRLAEQQKRNALLTAQIENERAKRENLQRAIEELRAQLIERGAEAFDEAQQETWTWTISTGKPGVLFKPAFEPGVKYVYKQVLQTDDRTEVEAGSMEFADLEDTPTENMFRPSVRLSSPIATLLGRSGIDRPKSTEFSVTSVVGGRGPASGTNEATHFQYSANRIRCARARAKLTMTRNKAL